MSFGQIGKMLGKDRTTIAKEIKKHSYERKSGSPGWSYNACNQLNKCTLKKFVYYAADAHVAFSEQLSIARSGILADERELQRINRPISPLIKNGQSVHQVYIHYIDELMCSEKTIYNYIDASLFDVRNIDLPTKVKRRPHYKKPEFKVDNGSEFSNPKEIEFGKEVTRRTNVFYCDPSCLYQKGAIEVNHELIHRILPKGTSFDNLT